MKLEFPLNEALPSTDHARDRLLAKIFRFRRNHQGQSGATDDDYALLYAYGEVVLLHMTPKILANPVTPSSFGDGAAFQRNQ